MNNASRLFGIIAIGFSPLLYLLVMYISTPGYIIPFLNHPICRLVTAVGLFWMVVGFGLMFTARKTWQFVVLWIFFQLPVIVMFNLGPAVVTIIQAIGPVMESADKTETTIETTTTETTTTDNPGEASKETPAETPKETTIETPVETPAK